VIPTYEGLSMETTSKPANTEYSDSKSDKEKILLESGRNEVEMLEFCLGGQSFGVNVAKVQTIIQHSDEDITTLPASNGKFKYMISIHDKMIPLVILSEVINVDVEESLERRIVILLSFNEIEVAILVDNVKGIHRINWNEFIPIDEHISKGESIVVSTFTRGEDNIVILDFEKIMSDFFPETSMSTEEALHFLTPVEQRHKFTLIHVDDSQTIRTVISKTLKGGGYDHIKTFNNGQDCFEYLKEVNRLIVDGGQKLSDHLHLFILDIEMPKMDGLTLCRLIREDLGWKDVPVIMFSSMIDPQMAEKCRQVGANTQCSKPDIKRLLDITDNFLGVQQNAPAAEAS
jgi:two-component system chemotaxis response regulator CheV